MTKNKERLIDRVRILLEKYPETRNYDKLLVLKYWGIYDEQELNGHSVFDIQYISKEFFLKATNPAHIIRVRAYIQKVEKVFIPTIWQVAEKRKWAKADWEQKLGYKYADDNHSQIGMNFGI